MAKITVAATTLIWHGTGTPAYLAVFANQQFVNGDNETVLAGDISKWKTYYKRVAVTYDPATGIVTVPSFTGTTAIDSTVTDLGTVLARYTVGLFTSKGTLLDTVYTNIKVGPAPSPTNWPSLVIYSQFNPQPFRPEYYTKEDINNLLQSLGVNNKQDTLVSGVNIKTVNTQTLLGPGNLTITGTIESVASNAATFAAILATAVANPTIIYNTILSGDVAISTPTTVPANVISKTLNGSRFVKSGTGTLNFQGVGLDYAQSKVPIFFNFASGEVTWTGVAGARPSTISTLLWDTNSSSFSARLDRADKSIADGSQVRIEAYPGDIDSDVNMRTYREVYFTPGDYQNANPDDFHAALRFNSHNEFHGTWRSRLLERARPNNHFFEPAEIGGDRYHDPYTDVRIHDLAFIGNQLADTGSGAPAVFFANTSRIVFANNYMENLHDYAVTVGGFGDTGYHTDGFAVTGNFFINCMQQVVAVLNARNGLISGNYWDGRHSIGRWATVFIDFEPNTDQDVLENIIIENNLMDARQQNPPNYNFAPSAVDISANTINLPNHGIDGGREITFTTTGTLPSPLAVATTYEAIVVDKDHIQISTIAFPNPLSPIDLTTQGTGTHTIATNPFTILTAISINSSTGAGAKNITIRNNTIYSGDIIHGDDVLPSYPTTPAGTMSVGISLLGVEEGYVYGNTIRGGSQGALTIVEGRDMRVYNNDILYSFLPLAIWGTSDSDISNNRMNVTSVTDPANQRSFIQEDELFNGFVSSGSTLTVHNLSAISLPRPQWKGQIVTINNVDYTVATWNGILSFDTTVPVGTLTTHTFLPADVNTGTDTIAVTAHGFNTGAIIWLDTTGALPAHTVPDVSWHPAFQAPVYYLIRVDADHIKLASTLANALANVAIDLTTTGSGTQTITPMFRTKFLNNRYADNKAPGGIILESKGSSQILSTAHDKEVTNVTDAGLTITTAHGIIVHNGTTASRTDTLPDATICRGKEFTIKDGTGNAATFHLILSTSSSQTIDGASTVTISSNYGILKVKSDGANWKVIQVPTSSLPGVGNRAGETLDVTTQTSSDAALTIRGTYNTGGNFIQGLRASDDALIFKIDAAANAFFGITNPVRIQESYGLLLTDSANQWIRNGSAGQVTWDPTNSGTGLTPDSGIARVAGKVLKVTDGSTGLGWMQNAGRGRVATNVTNATATMANITDLSRNVQAGRKYSGTFTFIANNSTGAEGLQFDFNGGSATWTSVQFYLKTTPIGATLGVTRSTALGTALTATAVATGDTVYEVFFEGVVNAAGTLIPRFAEVSHTSGTGTVKSGSTVNIDDLP